MKNYNKLFNKDDEVVPELRFSFFEGETLEGEEREEVPKPTTADEVAMVAAIFFARV